MLRTLLIISLIFCISIFPGTRPLYATCGTCGIPAPGEGGTERSPNGGTGSGADAAILGLMFGALMAAKAQEEAVSEDEKLDKLARELALAFNTIDPTEKYRKEKNRHQ